MSLLLDALKRAEQEKIARNGDRPEEPASARQQGPSPTAPNLELQPIGSAPGSAQAKGAQAAQAAQVVFQAKTAANSANEPRHRGMLLGTIVGAIVIVVVAAGAYVWHTIRTLTPQQTVAHRARLPAPSPAPRAGSVPAGEAQPGGTAPFSPLAPGMISSAPAAGPAPVPAPRPAELTVPRPAELTVSEPRKAPTVASPSDPERLVREVLRESAAQPPAAPLRLERTAEGSQVPRDIAAGYQSLQRGELAPARRSYQAALAAEGPSLDAHLGLATVEAQSGNRAAAVQHYRKALELDPRNVTALAGLAALADYSRPEALEGQLREDLMRHPESAPLRFALGNLYASQSRWSEAQAEFFEAYRLDPTVADVLYNLAVTLDHLGQPRLAAEFYRRALDASRSQVTQFDPLPVARRLAELRP